MQADRVELVFVLVFLVAVLAAFLPIVGIFVAPFAAAVTFVAIFYPAYEWLLKRLRNNRAIASLLTCALFVVILLIPGRTYSERQPLFPGFGKNVRPLYGNSSFSSKFIPTFRLRNVAEVFRDGLNLLI